MAHRQLRNTYGHGAAKIAMAPAFMPSPYSQPDSLAANFKLALRDEHPARLVARVLGGSAGAVAGAFALALLLAPLFRQPPDDQGPQIVMMAPAPVEEEELLPPPEPEPLMPEPEPEPVQVAEEPPPAPEPMKPEPPPPPVKIAKKPPPPPPMPLMPAPAPPPKEPAPAPVRVAREPVKKPPTVVSIDPLAPVPAIPSERPAPAPLPTRTAARAPSPTQRTLPALADFTPIGDPAPSGRPAAVASRAVRTNVVAPSGGPSRPPAFAAAAPPAAFDEEASAPAPAARTAVQRPHVATASSASRPNSLGFAPAKPGAQVADTTSTSVGRTDRALPQRSSGSGQNDNLAAVPLGSLASCATDREEDQRKMALLTAVRGRTECSSAAGRYRFVETKNLNAFLMWIERAPNRAAVDRCVELRLALECLGG